MHHDEIPQHETLQDDGFVPYTGRSSNCDALNDRVQVVCLLESERKAPASGPGLSVGGKSEGAPYTGTKIGAPSVLCGDSGGRRE
jgi:hypothetical protein